jgi:methyl-accepting chemotaxis protein
MEATQAFLLKVRDSPYPYTEVLPVFITELNNHVTTRVKVLNTATLESLRALTDVIVKEASTSAAALVVDVSSVIATVEAGIEKAKDALQSLEKPESLADVATAAGAVANVVENAAESAEKVAIGVSETASHVGETVSDLKTALEGAGLGGEAVTKAADAVQTGVAVVTDVAKKAEDVAKKVDEIADKAEDVAKNAVVVVAQVESRVKPILQALRRYLCCCCGKK